MCITLTVHIIYHMERRIIIYCTACKHTNESFAHLDAVGHISDSLFHVIYNMCSESDTHCIAKLFRFVPLISIIRGTMWMYRLFIWMLHAVVHIIIHRFHLIAIMWCSEREAHCIAKLFCLNNFNNLIWQCPHMDDLFEYLHAVLHITIFRSTCFPGLPA